MCGAAGDTRAVRLLCALQIKEVLLSQAEVYELEVREEQHRRPGDVRSHDALKQDMLEEVRGVCIRRACLYRFKSGGHTGTHVLYWYRVCSRGCRMEPVCSFTACCVWCMALCATRLLDL